MRKALLGTGLATAAAAVVGGVASREGVQGWYTEIRKPGYVPPNAVFPIAWTALYVDIAATSAAVINRFRADGEDGKARAYIAALGANLTLNAGWSWVFFAKRQLGPSVVVAAALAASSADLARRAGDADLKFGAALAPYPLWCSFATVMSADIWRLNR
ncbi:MAG: TspO/MBR family protein [Mycobacteriaceae bacterium]